ncbi:hypothetical protein [Xenorhabdus sp. TS4]|uniref:hypothetical protein n=1 Tax=Xenorhabdus sp. TS4 TaxID=1873483 RepID=UPI00351C8F25
MMNSNPMFAAMMAINSIGGTDVYQVYRDAAIDTLRCNEMDSALGKAVLILRVKVPS